MAPVKKYGWKPDLPDHRDYQFKVAASVAAALPPKVDLGINCPPVVDQGNLGSCTANAIANAHRFDQIKQKAKFQFLPSRLFIYYNERVMEGSVPYDAGAMIRDGVKSINVQGVCTEKTWPYIISKFTRKPTKASYTQGLVHQSLLYQRVTPTLDQLKGTLASGLPFVFGFTVYESFESQAVTSTGIVPMPSAKESVLGGHAVLCVGYDDATQRFKVQNSWGVEWGDKGYFYMPYAYLTNTNLADDFWVIQSIEI